LNDVDVEGEQPDKVEYKQMWWDGVNLHLISEDDRHVVLTNCTVHTVVYTIEDSTGITYEETTKEFKAKGKLELTN